MQFVVVPVSKAQLVNRHMRGTSREPPENLDLKHTDPPLTPEKSQDTNRGLSTPASITQAASANGKLAPSDTGQLWKKQSAVPEPLVCPPSWIPTFHAPELAP